MSRRETEKDHSVEGIETMSAQNETGVETLFIETETKFSETKQEFLPCKDKVVNSTFHHGNASELSATAICEANESNQIRHWFENLDSKNQIAALGFFDNVFLATLMAMATRLASETAVSVTSDDSHVDFLMPISTGSSYWQRLVDVEEAEAIVNKFGSSMSPPVASRLNVSGDESGSVYSLQPTSIGDILASNVFRIRNDSDFDTKAPLSMSFESEEAKIVETLLSSICVVFPSACCCATGLDFSDLNQTHPFVTINPLYAERASEGEIFFALDTMARTVFGVPFLLRFGESSEESIVHSAKEWLTPFVRLHGSTPEVPYYSFLLTRFEEAVRTAFQNDILTEKPAFVSPANDAILCPELSESEGIHLPFAKCSANVPQLNMLCGSSSNMTMTARMDFLKNLEAQASSLVGASSKGNILELEAVKTSAFCLHDQEFRKFLDLGPNIIFMPISFLLNCKGETPFQSLIFLNAFVDDALQLHKIFQNGGVPGFINIAPHERANAVTLADDAFEMSDALDGDLVGSTAQSIQRNKRRKNKKRKGKIALNVNVTEGTRKEQTYFAAKGTSFAKNTSKSGNLSTFQRRTPEKAKQIAVVMSTDSDDTDMKMSTEAVSVNSGTSVEDLKKWTRLEVSNGDVAKARADSMLAFATPTFEKRNVFAEPEKNYFTNVSKDQHHNDDDHAWVNVEVRTRGSRKKTGKSDIKMHKNSYFSGSGGVVEAQNSASRKSKTTRVSVVKKKNLGRVFVKEILNSLLDKVEDEARRGRKSFQRPSSNPWISSKNAQSKIALNAQRADEDSHNVIQRGPTLRDVVLGRHISHDKARQNGTNVDAGHAFATGVSDNMKLQTMKDDTTSVPQIMSSKRNIQISVSADQNTAPTYQETLSAISTSSNAVVTVKLSPSKEVDRVSKSDSISVETDEALQNCGHAADADREKDELLNPPLPTLLSPEHVNSANSSVASSLEVPHTSRRHHHPNSVADVADVGYHLLDVCDRLSRDMALFMSHRALALNTRRKERGALLSALQNTISSIWPVHGHAELYGSCASQLDLPSSDLDVVIIGIDQYSAAPSNFHNAASRSKSPSDSNLKSVSTEEANGDDMSHLSQHHLRHHSLPNHIHVHTQINADRVRRLALELETQPWAVHINAIPTASVPVVKVLADPLKLTFATSGSEWVMHHKHPAKHTPGYIAQSHLRQDFFSNSEQHVDKQPVYQPHWRGADVVNGLLSLDITFDGPEHGGIGSTHYSAGVVAEACLEFGAPPDATPLVQVVMVLKELLVQRKLNEPYSGGLSSYALLLLVVALMRERAVIREEVERAERQRKAMTAGDEHSTFAGVYNLEIMDSTLPLMDLTIESVESTRSASNQNSAASVQKGRFERSTALKEKRDSSITKRAQINDKLLSKSGSTESWASIAGKNSTLTLNKEPHANKGKPNQTIAKPTSFADAVARSITGSTTLSLSTSHPSSPPASVASRDTGRSIPFGPTVAVEASETHTQPEDLPMRNHATTNVNVIDPLLDVPSLEAPPSHYPQGYNDVIEVLCSGSTTAGKLLMHFLLYYGDYFEAQTTAIDISGKHERGYPGEMSPYSYYSPYIQRRAPGTIDPVTGMLTVEPIVIYDPLEGAEHNNVARRCFAWSSVRWIFAQSYATLSSAVERSATPPTTPNGKASQPSFVKDHIENDIMGYNQDGVGDLMDPSSPLLRCLLSF